MAALEPMSADPSRPLQHQEASVTGGRSGTGDGCGFALDATATSVVINNYFDAGKAGRVAATTRAISGVAIQADVNNEKQVQAMFAETTGRFGEQSL